MDFTKAVALRKAVSVVSKGTSSPSSRSRSFSTRSNWFSLRCMLVKYESVKVVKNMSFLVGPFVGYAFFEIYEFM